ncbi:tol-pal system YbgF family protein [Kribbella sp. NPDC004536]|uniref:tetratricopeptide repeat protein n=1 Tax=Kribbella sp. NPDC004536 TaxID=3364106 RepID=UPI0036A59B2B
MSYQQLPPPTGLPYLGPPPRQPSKYIHDPLAVALGNASLLGLGYFLIRRWLFGALGLIGTAVLVVLLCSQREPGYEFALIAWGLLQVVHGWFLASRQPLRAANLTKRLVALGVTLLVFAGVAFERYDAHRIDQEAVASRDAGSCDGVRDARAKYNLGHRIGDAPRTTRVETDVAACDRIDVASDRLRTAKASADVAGMQGGFNVLASVLAQPNQEHTVKTALDEFLNGLPVKDPCQTLAISDWLRARTKANNILDQANAAVPRIEPNALLGCGDAQAAAKDWPNARNIYAQLVTRYPHSKQADRARAGMKKADHEILQAKIRAELARVRGLVASGKYCETPAKFSLAPRLRPGVNRAVFTGADDYVSKLPSQWKGTTADNAALVICAGEDSQGPAVRTCQYEGIKGYVGVRSVTFHKIAVPVNVYELRTGRLIKKTTVQISGSACPATISFTTYYGVGSPDPDMDVTPTTATIQEAFRPLVVR